MYTNMVLGEEESVLFREVSDPYFRGEGFHCISLCVPLQKPAPSRSSLWLSAAAKELLTTSTHHTGTASTSHSLTTDHTHHTDDDISRDHVNSHVTNSDITRDHVTMASSLGGSGLVGGASDSRGVVSKSLPLHTTDVHSLKDLLQDLKMKYGIRGVSNLIILTGTVDYCVRTFLIPSLPHLSSPSPPSPRILPVPHPSPTPLLSSIPSSPLHPPPLPPPLYLPPPILYSPSPPPSTHQQMNYSYSTRHLTSSRPSSRSRRPLSPPTTRR